MTPNAVSLLVIEGHDVLVQMGAGVASGFSDDDYQQAGADLVATLAQVYERAELIVKVEEPQPIEYDLMKKGQCFFCYFNWPPSADQQQVLKQNKATCLAYQAIRDVRGAFPLKELRRVVLGPNYQEASLALTRITLEYISKVADKGYAQLALQDAGFLNAIQVQEGKVLT